MRNFSIKLLENQQRKSYFAKYRIRYRKISTKVLFKNNINNNNNKNRAKEKEGEKKKKERNKRKLLNDKQQSRGRSRILASGPHRNAAAPRCCRVSRMCLAGGLLGTRRSSFGQFFCTGTRHPTSFYLVSFFKGPCSFFFFN